VINKELQTSLLSHYKRTNRNIQNSTELSSRMSSKKKLEGNSKLEIEPTDYAHIFSRDKIFNRNKKVGASLSYLVTPML